MSAPTYLSPDGLDFLKGLARHNDKAWFEKNKARYELGLRAPGLRLVADLGPVLAKISPHFRVDPRPNGGSLSRIHRDTRFSRDKTPYKTHLFFHFHHEDGSDEVSPGFFLRLGPGESRVGGGVWRPAPGPLGEIRRAIATDATGWTAAKKKATRGDACMLDGDALKKVPRGFDPDHVHAGDLRRRDLGVSVDLPDDVLTSPGLLPAIARGFRAVAPVVAFLCEATGLPF